MGRPLAATSRSQLKRSQRRPDASPSAPTRSTERAPAQGPLRQQARAEAQGHRLSAAGPRGTGAAIQRMQPNDDRGWWQRNAPYLLGGTAPGETRNYWQRNAPTLLGGLPVPEPPAPPTRRQRKRKNKRGAKPKAKPELDSNSETESKQDSRRARSDEPPLSDDDLPDAPDELLLEPPQPSQAKPKRRKGRKKKKKNTNHSDNESKSDAASELSPDEDDWTTPSLVKKQKKQRAREQRKQRAERELRKYHREVVRTDRNFDNTTNSRGQGKSHRLKDGSLAPAGDHEVSAIEQLNQDSPHKGQSNRSSFTGPKADNPQSYGPSDERQSVTFKLRKYQRAKLKGKDDAQQGRALSYREVRDEIRNDKSHYAQQKTEQDTTRRQAALNYARSDAEHQFIGTIPRRFLKYSDDASSDDSGYDSDSDSEPTEDEDED